MTPHHIGWYLYDGTKERRNVRYIMSDKQTFDKNHNRHHCYEIRLKGHLDERWAQWFEGLTITREDTGDTLLTGPVVDQAALHGLLKKVRDLGIPLVSIRPVKPVEADQSDIKS
jgi:hypothetical protein